jgi:hypothetical protein
MSMKYCQGPKCHTYRTKDRLRGPKGDKHYQTRRRSSMIYDDSFCSQRCADDWFIKFGQRAVDHFGRIHEPIRLTEENAWMKHERYYNPDNEAPYFWYNRLTEQELPMTKEQFNNPNYTRPRRSTVVVVEATNSNGEVIQKDTLRF